MMSTQIPKGKVARKSAGGKKVARKAGKNIGSKGSPDASSSKPGSTYIEERRVLIEDNEASVRQGPSRGPSDADPEASAIANVHIVLDMFRHRSLEGRRTIVHELLLAWHPDHANTNYCSRTIATAVTSHLNEIREEYVRSGLVSYDVD